MGSRSRPFKLRSTSAASTTRPTASDRSPCPRWCWRGEFDIILPPRFGQAVADAIPGARFEILPGEAHQPFQEVPELSGTPASTPSGGRSRPGTEARSGGRRVGGAKESSG